MFNSVYYVHMKQPFSKTDLALERRLNSKEFIKLEQYLQNEQHLFYDTNLRSQYN